MTQSKAELIYIGDPMCSWCYGIADELKSAKSDLKNEVSFTMIMGGLRPFNKESMTDLADFLRHHWEDVAKASGQPFTYDILGISDLLYDTEIPCRATIIVRHLDETKEYAFFKAIQKAFYFDNKRTDDINTYLDICEELGIDKASFEAQFNSEKAKNDSLKDFEASRALGVNSFPTLLLRRGDKVEKIASGFLNSASIVSKVRSLLE